MLLAAKDLSAPCDASPVLRGNNRTFGAPPHTKSLPETSPQGTLIQRRFETKETPLQLKLSNRNEDGVLVVDCVGRIVFGDESGYLRDTVKQLIPDNKRIVLNLGEINYIDSGGLGTLVALYTSANIAGSSIKLANLTKRVGDLLQVTKLLTVFDVYDSEEKALEAFRKVAA
jgi:anti-sigma B factor antagonist